jgi:hypothetical protein
MATSLPLHDKKLPAQANETPDSAMEFEVLYYKRTNKVHKSKGVTKTDGVLTVMHHPKQNTVTLYDADAFQVAADETQDDSSSDDDSDEGPKKGKKKWQKSRKQKKSRSSGIVFSGVQAEIAKRAQTFQEDDIVALGCYDVQILGIRISKETAPKSTTAPSVLNTLHQPKKLFVAKGLHPPRKAVPLQSKRPPIGAKKLPTPLLPPNASQSCDTSTPDDAPTPLAPLPPKAVFQRRPLQSKSILASKNAVTKGIGVKSTKTTALAKKRPVASRIGALSPQPPKAAKSPKLASTPTILPDIPLPAAIRQVLRPHQVSGIDFLWNALTNSSTQGAILADEMGLGYVHIVCSKCICLLLWTTASDRFQLCVVQGSSRLTSDIFCHC